MDLSKLSTKEKAEEGVWLNILDQNGDEIVDEKAKTPVRFKIAGTNSKAFKAQQKAAGDANRRKKNGLSTAEALDYSKRMVAACVLEWEYVNWRGKELNCTQENILMILNESEPIMNQVNDFISDASNFLES